MRLLLDMIFSLFVVFLAFRLGGLWPILLIWVYILAFDTGLLSFSRRIQIARPFLVFLGLFASFVYAFSWVFYQLWSTKEVLASLKTDWWARLVLGSLSARVFWAALFATGVVSAILGCFLLIFARISAPSVYGQYEGYRGNESKAVMRVIYDLLGMSPGTQVVSKGKVESVGEMGNTLTIFGGPGLLIVQEGHAAILELGGGISRVVGKGLTWLKPFERVGMVVPLYTRTEKVTIQKVATNDRIVLDEIEVLVFHKCDPGEKAEVLSDGAYEYNPSVLTSKIWSPNGGDWRNSVQSVAESAIRDLVGRYDLEQIVPLSDQFRTEFKEQLIAKVNLVTQRALGVLIVAVDIGEIVVPRQVEERLLERQAARWEQAVYATRAETERRIQVSKARARMETIGAVSHGIQQLLESTGAKPTSQDLIVLRFIEYLEQRVQGPSGEDDTGTLLKLRSLEALGMLDFKQSGAHKSEGVDGNGTSPSS
jgi:regulator of protease activity HflC (stomatin/prohibitin superfamily)